VFLKERNLEGPGTRGERGTLTGEDLCFKWILIPCCLYLLIGLQEIGQQKKIFNMIKLEQVEFTGGCFNDIK
jgi:hypothetical protein